MPSHEIRLAVFASAVAATLCAAPSGRALAQSARVGGGSVAVGADFGVRGFTTEPKANELGKFLEYREIKSGLVLHQLFVGWVPADSFRQFDLRLSNAGQRDQSATLRLSQPGAWDMQLKWDRLPHLFSTTARAFGSLSGSNYWSLPTPRPDTTAWATTAPSIADIRTQWDAVRLAATYSPSPTWDLKAEGTNIDKSGFRPLGMAFGSPGNNLREIQEPIDQVQRDIRLTHSYQRTGFQLVASYAYSMFDNALDAVVADNPLAIADSPTAGSSRGRSALAPTNRAQTGSLTASINLPLHTRVSANGVYSAWTQNAPFIAPTINAAITDARIAAPLPKSLDARAGSAQYFVSATSRPITSVTLTGKYREYQYRDHTELESMPFLVVNDRSVSGAAERAALPFTRKLADVAASWRLERTIGWPLTLGAGWAWEHWLRSPARNVYRTTDMAPRATLDADLSEYAAVRVSYTKAWRRASDPYIQNTTIDAPDHRRFDEADRDRERTNVILTLTPIDPLTITGNWAVGHDIYPASPYGTQADHTTMLGGDVDWALTSRVSVWGGYTREQFRTRLRSAYRTTGQLSNPSYDWVANNNDGVTTTNLGIRAILVPGKWEAGGRWDGSHAKYQMLTANPLTPTGGTAAQNFAATASDLPVISQDLDPFSLYVRYQHSAAWAFTARFQAESYDQNDFRTLGLVPYLGNGVFLTNDYLKYNATYFTISFSYRPALLKIGRPAL